MATGIIYSPVSKMDISTLNEKALHALKYHQLLKLSSKYNVKKRWAKKDDLVKCLLAVKESMGLNAETLDNSINEDIEWTDGKEALKLMEPPARKVENICRSTFTIEKNQLNDSRATYNIGNNLALSNLDPRLTFDVPKKSSPKRMDKKKSQVKMLTVPASASTTRSVGKTKTAARDSPLKMSNRSITIKKSKDAMSPMKAARSMLCDGKRAPLLDSPRRTRLSVPQKSKENDTPKPQPRLSTRRKSKSDDPQVRRQSGLPTAPRNFLTPPGATNKRNVAKPSDAPIGNKPTTVTKMPNFAAIHQKQFSKMDSLDEYMNKKSERIKKLFGTPMSSRPVQQTTTVSKLDDLKEETTPRKILHQKLAKSKMEEAKNMMNRKAHLLTRTEVKDRNRSHIHGIRTNRRFELQMKFRNI